MHMDSQTLQKLQKMLEDERNKLTAELKTIAIPDPRAAGNWNAAYPQFEAEENASHASQEEEADEVEEYEVRLASEGSLETRLLAVNKALAKIKDRTYGICASCKKPIPAARLEANPAAEYDIGHEPESRRA